MTMARVTCQIINRGDAVAQASEGVNKPALERVLTLVNG